MSGINTFKLVVLILLYAFFHYHSVQRAQTTTQVIYEESATVPM